jgi:hypothetical protein
MKKYSLAFPIFAISFAILSCSLITGAKTPTPAAVENRIYFADDHLSFVLPDQNWDSKPSLQQSEDSLELISFTRREAILVKDDHAYYPTISIIAEELLQTMDPESYDEYVRTSASSGGMVIEIMEPLTAGADILPKMNGMGWKVLIHTQQGDSMGYTIHIVEQQTGIRFLLESTPENFAVIDPEFIEVIRSIKIE